MEADLGEPTVLGRSSIGVARIEGSWHSYQASNIWGGYNPENQHEIIGKSYGIVCINSVLYMWVGMFHTKEDQFDEVKIANSKDHGASWEFTDWSFTRKEGIMMPTVCNYGKNYEGAKDDYVYSYLIRFQSYEGPDDYPDKVDWLNCQKPGLIDLARVHKDQVLNRDAYSFFAGIKDGQPVWTKDVHQRKPVFENPDGVGWCINVSYNAGFNVTCLLQNTPKPTVEISVFLMPRIHGDHGQPYATRKNGEKAIFP